MAKQPTTALGKEPPQSHRLFAKRAALIAQRAAHWSSDALALPEDVASQFPAESAERFVADIRHMLDVIARDGSDDVPAQDSGAQAVQFLMDMAAEHEGSADRLAATFPDPPPVGVAVLRAKAARLREIADMVGSQGGVPRWPAP